MDNPVSAGGKTGLGNLLLGAFRPVVQSTGQLSDSAPELAEARRTCLPNQCGGFCAEASVAIEAL